MAKATLKQAIRSAGKLLAQQRRSADRLNTLFVNRMADMVDVTSGTSLLASVRAPVDEALADTKIAKSDFETFSAVVAMAVEWLKGRLTDEVLDDFERLSDKSSLGEKVQAVLVAAVAYNYVFVITRFLACTRELEAICRNGADAGTMARLEALSEFVASTAVDEVAQWSKLELVAKIAQLMAGLASASPAPTREMRKTSKWIAQQQALAAAFKTWRTASLPLAVAAHGQMVASLREH